MTLALILFAFTYCLMLALPRFRPFAALGGAGAFLLLGLLQLPFPRNGPVGPGPATALSGLFLITNCSLTENPPRDRHF